MEDLSIPSAKPVDLSVRKQEPTKLQLLPSYLQPYKYTGSAYIASLIAVGTGFPLDSIKTRQQTYKYKNVWECIVDTKKNEGIQGFYRGITAPLLSSAAIRATSISVYTYSKPFWSHFWSYLYSPASPDDSTFERLLKNAPISISSGAFAGVVCSLASSPFEFTKLASQIELLALRRKEGIDLAVPHEEIKARSTFHVARDMVKARGILSLYSGVRYQVARDFIGSSTYFLTYDSFKMGISELGGRTSDQPAHPASIAIAGAMAGTMSWLIIYPIDTYKSLVQRDIVTHVFFGDSTFHSNRTFDFMSGFRRKTYRGLGISLARTSVLGMTFFSCYEMLLKVL